LVDPVDLDIANSQRGSDQFCRMVELWHPAKHCRCAGRAGSCTGNLLMATEADVRQIALSLPGTTEEQWYQTPAYKVAGKGFLRLRTEAEGGLVVFVSDLGEKEALLTGNSDAFFTTPHYDGYPVVLVNLDKIDHHELRELITDSWLIKAPPKLRRQFEDQ
jgi:hypothetical protein